MVSSIFFRRVISTRMHSSWYSSSFSTRDAFPASFFSRADILDIDLLLGSVLKHHHDLVHPSNPLPPHRSREAFFLFSFNKQKHKRKKNKTDILFITREIHARAQRTQSFLAAALAAVALAAVPALPLAAVASLVALVAASVASAVVLAARRLNSSIMVASLGFRAIEEKGKAQEVKEKGKEKKTRSKSTHTCKHAHIQTQGMHRHMQSHSERR